MPKPFMETCDIVSGFVPVDMQTAANTGDYVSLKGYDGVVVVLFKGVGTAGDDPTLTIQQAQAVAGTNAKALNFTTIYYKQNTALTTETVWTKTTQTAANTYTDATSAEDCAIWAVDIKAEDLDVSGGFDCVMCSVADVGGNAQLGCAFYILYRSRYPQAIPATAITD